MEFHCILNLYGSLRNSFETNKIIVTLIFQANQPNSEDETKNDKQFPSFSFTKKKLRFLFGITVLDLILFPRYINYNVLFRRVS